jgi:hypothetical protein
MSIDLFMNDTCPKCRKPIGLKTITPHPNRRDLALRNFECADRGPVKTRILLLKSGESRPQVSRQVHLA